MAIASVRQDRCKTKPAQCKLRGFCFTNWKEKT